MAEEKKMDFSQMREYLVDYDTWLTQEEKSLSTRKQYIREAERFLQWIKGQARSRETEAGRPGRKSFP